MMESNQTSSESIVHRVERISIVTRARDMREITRDLQRWLDQVHAEDGLLTALVQHTSASLLLQENADPTVVQDLVAALEHLAPEDGPYTHRGSSADAMASHIRAMLTIPSVAIPVHEGQLMLGRRQGVFLAEHRSQAQPRDIALHYSGTRRAEGDRRTARAVGAAFASRWAT